jgi:hypothetical protein
MHTQGRSLMLVTKVFSPCVEHFLIKWDSVLEYEQEPDLGLICKVVPYGISHNHILTASPICLFPNE